MSLRQKVADVFHLVHRQVDRVAPPRFRRDMWIRTKAFYAEEPLRFTFYLAQVVLASMPILCFVTFCLSVFFALATGLLFLTLFWVGLASCILIPVLIVTFCMASCTWGFTILALRLSRLAYRAFKTAFSIGSREFRGLRSRYETDFPNLPDPVPAPSPLVSLASLVRPKAKRAAHKRDEKLSDGEQAPLAPHANGGSTSPNPEG